jgi:putative transposase
MYVMRQSFTASDRTCGTRRVGRVVLVEGIDSGLHRIERLMKVNALKARRSSICTRGV